MMSWISKQFERYQEVITYIIFGVLTTLVNFVVFYFFDSVLGISYLIANGISIVAAILFAYVTNKKYVFQSNAVDWKEQVREFGLFVTMRAGTGVFDMLSMFVLVSVLTVNSNLAKLLTQFIVVVLNYVFSKLVIFK